MAITFNERRDINWEKIQDNFNTIFMMNSIAAFRQTLFTQWNLMRLIRLVAGIFFAAQAIQIQDAMAGFISAIFLFQAVTNTGCCGISGCAVPTNSKNSEPTQVVEYEEIKNSK